mmetsp:Transcript_44287/g.111219  ORF Transcript_44287/g.111219 Transcript_44287/m.111219 type:complete len:326 (-) Transcript_44287:541-1518(-)
MRRRGGQGGRPRAAVGGARQPAVQAPRGAAAALHAHHARPVRAVWAAVLRSAPHAAVLPICQGGCGLQGQRGGAARARAALALPEVPGGAAKGRALVARDILAHLGLRADDALHHVRPPLPRLRGASLHVPPAAARVCWLQEQRRVPMLRRCGVPLPQHRRLAEGLRQPGARDRQRGRRDGPHAGGARPRAAAAILVRGANCDTLGRRAGPAASAAFAWLLVRARRGRRRGRRGGGGAGGGGASAAVSATGIQAVDCEVEARREGASGNRLWLAVRPRQGTPRGRLHGRRKQRRRGRRSERRAEYDRGVPRQHHQRQRQRGRAQR